jgi:excinuclease ABC subunit C
VLDELPGIGPAKRQAILRALGSVERLREASEEELARVPKISARDAARLYRFFHPQPAPEGANASRSPGSRGMVEGGEKSGPLKRNSSSP